ncbi:MAG: hypothetical protein AMS23_00660 [Bacteroides sp. SM1_62]|jgi:hypothetical protein|nr:MAG: hypothetical protein AMS26_13390 [Bacteroides sp. SM23_62]KPL26692.1 MAG: hypothetical protein AMS23_00660 [Bacteroides sp. SM1_62]
MAREVKTDQDYKTKLLKLIPSEIVAAYILIVGIIPADYKYWGTLITAVIMLVLIPFYLRRLYDVKRLGQIIYIMIAFIIWIYTLGEPFRQWGIWQEWIGSALLVLYTLTIPLFYHPRAETAW